MGGESTPHTKEDHLQAVNSNIKRTRQPSHWLINGKNNMGPGGGGGGREGWGEMQDPKVKQNPVAAINAIQGRQTVDWLITQDSALC